MWISKGITQFYSLTEKRQLKDFESLRKEYGLEKSDFYIDTCRYIIIKNITD